MVTLLPCHSSSNMLIHPAWAAELFIGDGSGDFTRTTAAFNSFYSGYYGGYHAATADFNSDGVRLSPARLAEM